MSQSAADVSVSSLRVKVPELAKARAAHEGRSLASVVSAFLAAYARGEASAPVPEWKPPTPRAVAPGPAPRPPGGRSAGLREGAILAAIRESGTKGGGVPVA